MSEPWRHRTVGANGMRIHLVEMGDGPLVLLVHGFPESWYSWRHQLPALAEAGYRAVAIDVRGYGRSSKPEPVDAYGLLHHVADNLGVVHALGEERAAIVGHDWGSPIAWTSALLRPDVFTSLVMLSVPYSPRGENRPTEVLARLAGDDVFYINHFQQPGVAEAEIEDDVRSWLLGFYFTASGDAPPTKGPSMALVPRGGRLRDRLVVPADLPPWLTEADLDVYVGEFERAGFRGPLNRYRNIDRDWIDLAPFAGAPITVPSLFAGGERDGPTIWGASAIARFPQTVPDLRGSHILEGCGHWVQQERADRTTELLLEFLAGAVPR